MMMLSKTPSASGGGMVGHPPKSNLTTPSFSPKTSLLQDSNVVIPAVAGEKLLPSLLQQIAKASNSLPGSTWTVPSCTSAFSPHNEQPAMTSAAQSPKSSVSMGKMDTASHLATQVLEHQLASQLLERYSQQLSPSHPFSSKLFSSNANTLLNNQLSTTNTLLSNQLTTTNTLLGNHLSSSHFLGSGGLSNSLPQQHLVSHPPPPLILPRFNANLSPANSPRGGIKEFMKSEENNSRRLRWKEEHGRILISIWKEKYPQVRAAKKIKEKHAIWQEIGEEYNKFCVKYDWPPRSTEQVKIKVKNCIDEYKQTIKYNQEYKTCPYFQDIDDIFGMSDPEKAAELQKAVSTGQSPSQGCNSDNAYWSGSSLPTQVKKRKLNISCNLEGGKEEGERKSPKSSSSMSSPLPTEDPEKSACSTQTPTQDSMYLINLPASQGTNSSTKPIPILPEPRYTSSPASEFRPKKSVESEEPRYDVKIGSCLGSSTATSPTAPHDKNIPISQFGELIRQLHEREDKRIDVYHRIDVERNNLFLTRERERYEAEYQLEKSRQVFLSSVIEKLIDVIKDKSLTDKATTSKLFPALRKPDSDIAGGCED
ncbi:hypothetical protein ACHWQZ_G017724 [Mnemiopsis leidyi]